MAREPRPRAGPLGHKAQRAEPHEPSLSTRRAGALRRILPGGAVSPWNDSDWGTRPRVLCTATEDPSERRQSMAISQRSTHAHCAITKFAVELMW